MGLSPGLEYEKALILDNHLKEMEIFDYLNSLDRTDLLLIRDIYYLFLGKETEEEKAITRILEKRGSICLKK